MRAKGGAMKAVGFDPATHTYEGNLPSVTQILAEAGLMRTDYCSQEDLDRGKAVHLACQYYDEADLDIDSVDPAIKGYLDAYVKWHRECGLKPDWIETPIRAVRGQVYAGTPDRIMVVRPRSLLDIKTGQFQPWHPIQCAAYVNMLEDPWSYSRFGLYLRSNGTYSMPEFPKSEYAQDLNVFLSALNIVNWKRKINGTSRM
jgi:hypothetical protein